MYIGILLRVYKRLSCTLSPLITHQPWTALIPAYYEHWGERWCLLCTAAKCFIIGAMIFHNKSTITNKQTVKSKHWPTSPLIDMWVLKFTPRAWLVSNQTRCGSLGTVGAPALASSLGAADFLTQAKGYCPYPGSWHTLGGTHRALA